ncbi:two component transcriptional regulator, LytTR family [Selenomonas sp. WCT3]|uniref:LytR/AlgR family response regulator transcription factor n=1 Tax=Selenomonas sp. WCT3 TaxID=3158785 RepID=UPI0008810FAE|nr:two component transcriptional regulator, LytTR family [Selenomonas ruminantium]
MKIAIVDDEAEAREELQQVLRSCGIALVEQADCWHYASGEEFLAGFQPDSFQLVFLDIRMEGMNGIETARLIRKQTANLPIVFLTSSADYALEGYQVFPAGYLLKPIRQGRLQLLDILQHCLPQAPAVLAVQWNGRKLQVPRARIAYVDVKGNRRVGGRRGCVVHLLADRELAVDTPYPEVAAALRAADFAECYNHLLVNFAAVETLLADGFELKNGERLPISRRLYREVSRDYMEYLLRK